jgi:ribosomal protein S18 acetylase RimI-like enzyme
VERIAVRKEERRKHIGETLLQFMLREIQEEDAAIYLHSQVCLWGFLLLTTATERCWVVVRPLWLGFMRVWAFQL